MRDPMNVLRALVAATALALSAAPAAARAADLDLDGDWTRDDGKVYRIEGDAGALVGASDWDTRLDVVTERAGPEAWKVTLRLRLRNRKLGHGFDTTAVAAAYDPDAEPDVLVLDWGWADLDDRGKVVERGTEPRTLRRTSRPERIQAPPPGNPEAKRDAFLDAMKKRVDDARAKKDVAALRALGREILKGPPGESGMAGSCAVAASYAFEYALEVAPERPEIAFEFIAACVLASEFDDAREAAVKLERADQGVKDSRGERVTEWIRRVESIGAHYRASGRAYERAAQIEGKVAPEDHDAVIEVARREGDAYQGEVLWFMAYFDPSVLEEPK